MEGGKRFAVTIALAVVLGYAGWLGYRYILWPDMSASTTNAARVAILCAVMAALIVPAARLTRHAWVGVLIPLGMSRALLYVADHSGTNSDGLEGVGALLILVGTIPCVLAVGAIAVNWARVVRLWRME